MRNVSENPDEDVTTEMPFSVQTFCNFLYCLFKLFGRPGGCIGRVGSLCSIGNFSVQGAGQRLVTWVTTGRMW